MIRNLALRLRPGIRDGLSLQSAVEWHVRDFRQRYRVDIELMVSGNLDTLPDRYGTCAFGAIQEALTNCVCHGQAQSIQIIVSNRGHQLGVSVSDDGIGFEGEQPRGECGLSTIDRRVKELNGVMAVSSIPGAGTTLSIQLPLRVAERDSLVRSAD